MKKYRSIQDLIDLLEEHGYTYTRSSGSHKIFSHSNKENVVLVWHSNPRSERPHPRCIKDILKKVG